LLLSNPSGGVFLAPKARVSAGESADRIDVYGEAAVHFPEGPIVSHASEYGTGAGRPQTSVKTPTIRLVLCLLSHKPARPGIDRAACVLRVADAAGAPVPYSAGNWSSNPMSDQQGDRMMAQELRYRDFRIMVVAQGTGWRVYIHEPGSRVARRAFLYTADPVGRTALVEEAKRIVDGLLLHSN
jgi:hypothetical protein